MHRGGVSQQREQHIQELLQTRPECTARNAERSVFDFGVNVKRGHRSDLLVVRITLPALFPQVAPQAQVLTPGVRHAWLDARGNIVGCSSLYSWNGYSRLAQVVTDILNQFVANPPQVGGSGQTQQSAAAARYSTGSSSSSSSSSSSAQRQGQSRRTSLPAAKTYEDAAEEAFAIPPVPDSFPELDGMSMEELEELRDDSKAFDAFFAALPVPQSTREMKDEITKSNQGQATTNLSYKERIERLQNSTLRLQEEAVSHWARFKSLEARQSTAMRQYDPLRLLTKLEGSCDEIDDESERLAQELLSSEVTIADFISRELELRKLYHLRRAKAERFRHQLKRI